MVATATRAIAARVTAARMNATSIVAYPGPVAPVATIAPIGTTGASAGTTPAVATRVGAVRTDGNPTVPATSRARAAPISAGRAHGTSAAAAPTLIAAVRTDGVSNPPPPAIGRTSGVQVRTVANPARTSTVIAPTAAARSAIGRGATDHVGPPRNAIATASAPDVTVTVLSSVTTGRRVHVPTARRLAADNQAQEAQAARQAAREQQVRRAEARIEQAELTATVEQPGDNEEIRRLRGPSAIARLTRMMAHVQNNCKDSCSRLGLRGMKQNVGLLHWRIEI